MIEIKGKEVPHNPSSNPFIKLYENFLSQL